MAPTHRVLRPRVTLDRASRKQTESNTMRAAIAIILLSVLPGVLCAHHSRADYDTSAFVEMEGELASMRWIKPHQSFEFLVEGADGEIESWTLEGSGTPQTDGVEILERFALDDDAARLNYTMTVSDPASFLEPVILAWRWIDIGERFSPHDLCEAE